MTMGREVWKLEKMTGIGEEISDGRLQGREKVSGRQGNVKKGLPKVRIERRVRKDCAGND